MAAAPPILRHPPEEFFAAGPTLDVAWAIRRDETGHVAELLAGHPELDADRPAAQGMTLLLWAYAHRRWSYWRVLTEHGANPSRRLVLPGRAPGQSTTTHLLNLAVLDGDDEPLTALLHLSGMRNTVPGNTPTPTLNAHLNVNYF